MQISDALNIADNPKMKYYLFLRQQHNACNPTTATDYTGLHSSKHTRTGLQGTHTKHRLHKTLGHATFGQKEAAEPQWQCGEASPGSRRVCWCTVYAIDQLLGRLYELCL